MTRASGQVVAAAQWRALDRVGEDSCRLCRASDGWLLVGHARFHDAAGFAALDYVIRCDGGWRTTSADVGGMHAGREVQMRILREGAQWWLNEIAQPEVAGAEDLDLSFTPASNLMPLRRLAGGRRRTLQLRAAWLDYPDGLLRPLDQIYRRGALPGVVIYEARQTGTSARLGVHASGFVTLYPGAWEGEVETEDAVDSAAAQGGAGAGGDAG